MIVKDTLPVRINLIGSCCFIADRKTENVCGLPANAKKFLETLAGLPQTPKSFSRHLRDSRKRQKVFRDTCGNSASRAYLSEWKNVTYNVKGNR
nr:MAG TPA: hypothetical protein [Caudoviricetes sp.]